MKLLINKNTIILLLLSFIVSCGGGGTGSSVSSNVKKIVALGDSIGAGFGGTNPWPRLVQEKSGVAVINQSTPGIQAAQSISGAIQAMDTHQPSHILVLLGTNDANNGSTEAAVSAMRRIVAEATARGIIPIIGTVPPVQSSVEISARTSQISSGYRAIGVTIAEVEGAFGSNGALYLPDQFHPNNAGQEVIANAFISVL